VTLGYKITFYGLGDVQLRLIRSKLQASMPAFLLALGWRAACAVLVLVAFLASVATTRLASAQSAPGAAAPAAAAPDQPAAGTTVPPPQQASDAGMEQRIQALTEAMERQQAMLDAQRARIEQLEAQAAAAPGATGGAPAEASDADLEAFVSSSDAEVSEYESPDLLEVYGYLDIGLQAVLAPDGGMLTDFFPTQASTFVLGNINLYFDANPHKDWRGLFELRFTNLPHGIEEGFADATGNTYQRTDTKVLDITSPDGRNKIILGSIMIERAFIEWHKLAFFKVRTGLWLTPYGIWNVDHGTPVQISLLQPGFIVDEAFPTRQLGVDLLGDIPAGKWNLGYHLYVSNGRSPSQFDFSGDKALGFRLRGQYVGDWTAALGVSGYFGSSQDVAKSVVSFQPFVTATDVTFDYDEWAISGDVSFDIGAFRLRTEAALRRVDYEPGKHEPNTFGPPGGTEPSRYYSSGYLLLAYRLPVWGLEPYLYQELTHRPSPTGDTVLISGIGVNVYFNPSVQLKSMAGFANFLDISGVDTRAEPDPSFAILTSRLVLVF
jgi:hypothetical protein